MSILWSNYTATKPGGGWPSSGLVVASTVITRAQNSRGVRVTLEYKTFVPDRAANIDTGYTVQAAIEEELDTNVFSPVAYQADEITDAATKAKQIIQLSRDITFDPGTAENLAINGVITTQISRTQGVLPPRYRISIYRNLKDALKPDLDSLLLSGYYTEFD